MPKKQKEEPRQFLIFNATGEPGVECGYLDSELIEGKDRLIEIMEEIAEDEPDQIENFTIFEVMKIEFTAEKQMTVTLNE